MNEVGTLSINESSLTNEDITVTYVPNTFVTNYEYTIYKDDVVYKNIKVDNSNNSNIKLDKTGTYKIVINAATLKGNSTLESGLYKIDKEAPTIEVRNYNYTISPGEDIDLLKDVKATDNIDGDITGSITTNKDKLNLNSFGSKKLTYTVVDSAGNKASQDITINVTYQDYLLNFNQVLLILGLVGLLIFLLVINRIVLLEKRFIKYTVNPLKDSSKSIFDKIALKLRGITYRISDSLDRFESARKGSKKYQKYVDAFSDNKFTAIDFISMKIITAFTFLIASIIIQTLRFRILNIFELVIPMAFGYFLLDIIYYYKYYKYRKKIEKDLLQAIIIMNNCFKSGRSITQAIGIVAEQLDGAISDEFKKMSLELSFGLDIEVVFDRFAKRIKLEEAAYLTSSLSVLNKTGGNIIKVFTSIEKTLFNRQKLNLELKSLTGSSRIIMYALTIMPVLFVIVISLISKDYYAPLFTSPLGFIIIGAIIILYIIYIIVVRKIMKVRM